MKSSTLKIYFNAAAEGNVEQLQQLLIRYPVLLNFRNKNTEHQSIYYAIKNLQKETSLFLINRGLKISHKELRKLITHEWYGSLASFYFLLEIGPDIVANPEGIVSIDYKSWLEERYINTYYSHRNIERLIKFLESSKKEINWQDILNEYSTYSGTHNRNANHLKFLRELKLRTLL